MLSVAPRIGVDLGTGKLLLINRAKKILFNEPTVLIVDVHTDRVQHFGKMAAERAGKLPGGTEAIYPIRRGAIADYAATLYLLRRAVTSALRPPRVMKPVVVMSTPIRLTSVEERALCDVVREAGAGMVYLVPCNLASYLEMSNAVDDPTGSLVVDIGAGVTDISVIASNEIIVARSVPVGGDDMTDIVQRVMEMSFGVRVSRNEAEEIKGSVGVQDYGKDEVMTRRRAELNSGDNVNEVRVPLAAVSGYLRRQVQPLLDGLFAVLESTPPELFEDIYRKGIYLTGGASRTQGIDRLIEERAQMAVNRAATPEHTVILGIGRILSDAKCFQSLARKHLAV
jgi:rod shape-determining protein MreB and related proteins